MDKKLVISYDDNLLKNAEPDAMALAKSEGEQFLLEKLEQEAAVSEHGRKEDSRAVIHKCSICLMIAIYLVMIAGVFTLGWHWMCPEKLHFLTHAQIDTIKNILLSGLAANFAKEFYKKHS